jgi:hypothetical protein
VWLFDETATRVEPHGGSSMSTYDEMSPAERRQLIEALGSLTGLQEGPNGRPSSGAHYEYDPDLKRTVEVTPSGERFPVALVGDKLIRDSEKSVLRKGEAA